MDGVVQGWLVYELTGSAVALGWVSASRSITLLLFSLYGGVLSDRFPKRSVLIWVRWVRLAAHLAIAVLVSLGAIRVWHLALRSLLSGLLLALIMPAERSIVPELVDRRTLLNAMALTSIATGLMGMLAAWAAGIAIDALGAGAVYYAIVAFHFLTLLVVARLPTVWPERPPAGSIWSDQADAARYVWRQPALLALLGLALATVVLGRSYETLLPKFASGQLGLAASGLGLLVATRQLGSLVSSVAVALLGRFQSTGKLLLTAGAISGAALILFGNVHLLGWVIALLALAGAGNTVCLVTTQALLQVNAEQRLLGRVMSLQIMMSGLAPLGTLPASYLADRAGVPIAVSVQGAALLAVFGLVGQRSRVRQLK